MRQHNLTQSDHGVPEYAVVWCPKKQSKCDKAQPTHPGASAVVQYGNLTLSNLAQSDHALSDAQMDEQLHGLTYQPNQT
jgi:hypothetical protein